VNDQGADGDSALHCAAKKCHVTVTQILISVGVDVNVKNRKCVSPFFVKCRSEQAEIVNLLIAVHADVNCQADHGIHCL
jgi:ankyrin repeat protein